MRDPDFKVGSVVSHSKKPDQLFMIMEAEYGVSYYNDKGRSVVDYDYYTYTLADVVTGNEFKDVRCGLFKLCDPKHLVGIFKGVAHGSFGNAINKGYNYLKSNDSDVNPMLEDKVIDEISKVCGIPACRLDNIVVNNVKDPNFKID